MNAPVASFNTDQMKQHFEGLKEQVKQELTGENNALENMQTMQTSNSKENLHEQPDAAAEENGLKDIDMMDVQELENRREQEEQKEPFV